MKTMPVSPRAKSLFAALNAARKENLILLLPDGTEFILAEVDSFDREIELTRQNQQLMSLLEDRSQQTTRVTLAEARRRLGISSNDAQ
ncbi:MAG: hypothetical protein KA259_02655 [Caldilineaceae bacterium]|nr:hypothetical protein [Caldilineaceae bacterium]MBP8292477.1 hypothetical protein [Caldilineaceae bacterium]